MFISVDQHILSEGISEEKYLHLLHQLGFRHLPLKPIATITMASAIVVTLWHVWDSLVILNMILLVSP